MLKSPLMPRLLLGIGVLALLIVGLGLYQFFDQSDRYNRYGDLIAGLKPSLNTTPQNEATLRMLADMDIAQHAADSARNQSTILIGVGAVLLGIVVLIYTRLPEPPKPVEPVAVPPHEP